MSSGERSPQAPHMYEQMTLLPRSSWWRRSQSLPPFPLTRRTRRKEEVSASAGPLPQKAVGLWISFPPLSSHL